MWYLNANNNSNIIGISGWNNEQWPKPTTGSLNTAIIVEKIKKTFTPNTGKTAQLFSKQTGFRFTSKNWQMYSSMYYTNLPTIIIFYFY